MVNKKKGLGRGIDALFDVPDFENEVSGDDERVELISLEEIRPNPYQPRRHFDEDALNELAKSISVSGVLQPIILRQSSVKGYEIIAGERRFRASKIAEKEKIPAIIRELNEEVMMQVAILENLQREDLTSLEEAEAYNMMMEKLSMTQEKVAEKLGKSRSYIANHLRLLTLPAEVKNLLQENKLSNGQARTLLGLKDKKKLTKFARRTVKEGLTVRQLEHLVAEANQKPKIENKKQVDTDKSIYIRRSEELLTDKFGTSVVIREKGKKGKIEIEYVSQDDLNRILEDLDIEFE
ncbi:ParB/RepB/Spo0J family partition protein [Marinilactibacillus psychrotolerans]|uniref:Chromosome partitioning protein ParB n=1 Tax=Marinilactibacillus psychrotolerans TaxID=191770 RepID=A0AAV3WVH6_9LACT|nr:ParB/RepB/Spo0J family partition protein [Marinilactibacillus psychrotolerans]GEL67048.1 chromosome partitioning protein ParB [Marinilactibacillus psychrotolerans]GEQ36193.1 chromosome partitioning protein ParB [Marinilactibacillus psychrotolerans]SDC77720.1 chromosome partitioning protein, ParB family [Marinilactibacillus psychrotolerans]